MASFTQTPDYQGNRETVLQSCLIAFSTIFFGMRVYARAFMTKSLWWDDGLVGVAWVFVVVQSALDIRAVTLGSGAHIDLIPQPLLLKFFESLVVQTLIYFWVVALVRLSILLFLVRISQEKRVLYAASAVGGVIIAQSLAATIYRLCECLPVSDNFLPPNTPGLNCLGLEADQRMMVSHGAVGIVVDIALLILPVYVIYTKMIFSRKAVQVMLILSVGVFVIVTGIVRLAMILTLNFAEDPTFKMATIGIWSNLEGHVGLWCSCFPALQPLIRMVSFKLGMRSSLDSHPATHPYGRSMVFSGKHGYIRNGSGVDIDDSDSQLEQLETVISAGKPGVGIASMEPGRIQRTTEVEIHTETYDPKALDRKQSWDV